MQKRIYKPFIRDVFVPKTLDSVELSLDNNNFCITVTENAPDNGMFLEINFYNMCLAQRSMDEGKYLMMEWEYEDTEETKDLPANIVLVENSEFLKSYTSQISEKHKSQLYHIMVITMNEWYEVISTGIPDIKWITRY